MDKTTSRNVPETKVSEEVYMENGNAVYRKIEEVIETREETTMMLPLEMLKKKMIVCTHAKAVTPVFIKYDCRAYFSDILKGEDILRILSDENGRRRSTVNVAVLQIDGSVAIITADIQGFDRYTHIRPDREYRISCLHCPKASDGECLIKVRKTGNKLFRRFDTMY